MHATRWFASLSAMILFTSLFSLGQTGTLAIEAGGMGSTTASQALSNLGGLSSSGGTLTGGLGQTIPSIFTKTFNHPNVFLQNMIADQVCATQNGTGCQSDLATVTDGLSIGQTIPFGATVGQTNGVGVYQLSMQAGALFGLNPAGYYSRELAGMSEVSEWGSNYNLSDTDSSGIIHQGTTMFGTELDLNVNDPSSAGAAILLGTIMNAQGAVGGFYVGLPNQYRGNHWSYGILMDDGSVGPAAITMGSVTVPLATSAAYGTQSSDSQNLQHVYRDSSGNSHFGVLYTSAGGTMHSVTAGGFEVDGGNLVLGNGILIGSGGDYAESVDVASDPAQYEPWDVLVIDPDIDGKFIKGSEPYSKLVAGIYSTKPGIVGRRQTTNSKANEVPMAMVGIVPTKVSAENGPIRRGNLFVMSSTRGHAMKGTDPTMLMGAVIGKALGSLASGTGVIEVLVSLQ